MSCDRSRSRVFGPMAQCLEPLVGGRQAAYQLLEMVYDVAVQQPPPTNPAGLMLAEARTRQMMTLAEQQQIDLYPHKAKTGLPPVEMQQGWRAVAELMDAVEKERPLSELAAQAQATIAFARVLEFPSQVWNLDLRPVTRQVLREAWLLDPERVRALAARPEALAGEEHAPLLAAMTARLVEEPEIPPFVRAAAQQYLGLHEAEMLESEQRATWALALGAAVGFGNVSGNLNICSCGARMPLYLRQCSQCDPTAVERQGDLAVACARRLVDSLYAAESPKGSLREQAEQALAPWLRRGEEPPPGSPEAQMLAALRVSDRQLVKVLNGDGRRRIRLDDSDRIALRRATLRSPLLFNGQSCVWDNGRLYSVAVFRLLADLDRLEQPGSCVPDSSSASGVMAEIDDEALAGLLAGRFTKPQVMRFPTAHLAHYYNVRSVRGKNLAVGSLVVHLCGCMYECEAGKGERRQLRRVVRSSKGCHEDRVLIGLADVTMYSAINYNAPRFALPTWPEATPGGS